MATLVPRQVARYFSIMGTTSSQRGKKKGDTNSFHLLIVAEG